MSNSHMYIYAHDIYIYIYLIINIIIVVIFICWVYSAYTAVKEFIWNVCGYVFYSVCRVLPLHCSLVFCRTVNQSSNVVCHW